MIAAGIVLSPVVENHQPEGARRGQREHADVLARSLVGRYNADPEHLAAVSWHASFYRDAAPGVDVRASFSDEDLVRSQRTAKIGTAREIASTSKATITASVAEGRIG